MSETEPMNINERRKYLHKMWGRYKKANKMEKSKLLSEMEAVTGMHRKSIIRLLNNQLSRKKRTRERGRTYGVDVDDSIRKIANSLDYPCAERLHPNLYWMAEHLRYHGELQLQEKTKESLQKISESTLKRILKRIGRSEPKMAEKKPRKSSNSSIRNQYPMTRIAWNIPEPGHFEVDLVHHCGATANGEFYHTLQMVDVATGWSEATAILGRSFRVMKDGFDYLLNRLPFPILEIHPDNGAEFFNQFLLQYWKNQLPDLEITRSRPYQKNDNRFVEENNQSMVRAYIGHSRLDTFAQLKILRQLLDKLWLFHNFFQPVMRLKEKQVISSTQFRRKYDQATTPFDRLKEKDSLNNKNLSYLENLRRQTNPVNLRYEINTLITVLLSLPCLDKSETVNIFTTFIKENDISVTLSNELTKPSR